MLHRPETLGEAVGLLTSRRRHKAARGRRQSGGDAQCAAGRAVGACQPGAGERTARQQGSCRWNAAARCDDAAPRACRACVARWSARRAASRRRAQSPIRLSAPWERSAARSPSTIRARIIRRPWWHCRRRSSWSERLEHGSCLPLNSLLIGTPRRCRPMSWSPRSISPPVGGGAGVYHKLARVAGDFAIVSVAIVRHGEGRVRAVIGACGPRPLSLPRSRRGT